MRELDVRVERWPIRGEFRIARGSKTEAVVVVAGIRDGDVVGRGEAVPYARYGESVDGVVEAVRGVATRIAGGGGREALASVLGPGAARNAIDCALWDLEARLVGTSVHALAGIADARAVETCFTLGVAEPEALSRSAAELVDRTVLKVKLAGDGADIERLTAVHDAAPSARIVADANESWTIEQLGRDGPKLAALGVVMLEQPLREGADDALVRGAYGVPIAADESVHDRAGLERVATRYDAINVKLDKTGGLTEAIALVREARERGLGIMIGCMVCTSLGIAPAMLLANDAGVVDLDGPWLLDRDRDGGARYEGALVHPPSRAIWAA